MNVTEIVSQEDGKGRIVEYNSSRGSGGFDETLQIVSHELHISFFDNTRFLSLGSFAGRLRLHNHGKHLSSLIGRGERSARLQVARLFLDGFSLARFSFSSFDTDPK